MVWGPDRAAANGLKALKRDRASLPGSLIWHPTTSASTSLRIGGFCWLASRPSRRTSRKKQNSLVGSTSSRRPRDEEPRGRRGEREREVGRGRGHTLSSALTGSRWSSSDPLTTPEDRSRLGWRRERRSTAASPGKEWVRMRRTPPPRCFIGTMSARILTPPSHLSHTIKPR
ncbi:hypothetical protein ANO11243_065160 [Dothideomycetidae sp. 11243]|nr:hypothetical protein ANO11243_065160 [fungal sp. No.11243]